MYQNTPYTYLIEWTELKIRYYGCRYSKDCHPSDFWVDYFTSSEYVSEFIKNHGEPDRREIRKIFTDSDYKTRVARCQKWEDIFLKRVDAVRSEFWLNKSRAGKDFNNAGKFIEKDATTHEKIGTVSTDHPKVLSGEWIGYQLGMKRDVALCEFCNNTFGKNNIKKHSDSCPQNPNRIPYVNYGVKKLKTKCTYCDDLFGSNTIQSHENSCEMNPNKTHGFSYGVIMDKTACKYCGEVFGKNRLWIHEESCSHNPDKIKSSFGSYKRDTFVCDWCGDVSLGLTNYQRWHGDNCTCNPESPRYVKEIHESILNTNLTGKELNKELAKLRRIHKRKVNKDKINT